LLLPHAALLLAFSAGKYVERVALPFVFKYLVSELAAMNIRCSLDIM
jgi:DNA-directed RNA polymerase beta subunit